MSFPYVLVSVLFLATATAGESPDRMCEPLETRAPNAAGQEPAFPGQTRACEVHADAAFDVIVLASDLEYPWAIEPMPNGDLLVTEKPGTLRIVSAAGETGSSISGVPEVDYGGQGGLLDVALSPKFETDRTIFLSYSEPRDGGNATSVARGVLSEDASTLEEVRVIFRAQPIYDGDKHFGSRLAFDDAGHLYISLGDRSDQPMRAQAQQLDSHMGKILRINADGSVPKDNPFAGRDSALPEIWSLGHRNVQAMAFDAGGQLWEIEHGTRGGDELNRIVKGKNYGWPLVAYGEEYAGTPILSAKTQRSGYEQPVYYWDPVIAPSGAVFHSGNGFSEWRGNLFIGGLGDGELVRLVLEDGKVIGEEHLLAERGERIRDVREGPDGALYIVTDSANGELWKITPSEAGKGN